MKSLVKLGTFILIAVLAGTVIAYGDDMQTVGWVENNPTVAIYDDPLGINIYDVTYNHTSAEQISTSEDIRLLMVDGGFVPYPNIIIENGRALVPVDIIVNIFGITTGSHEALVVAELTKTVNSSLYVPLRLACEAFGADVQYIPQLTYSNSFDLEITGTWIGAKEKVSVIVIEKAFEHEKVFTVDEGLDAVKKASVESYEEIIKYFTETGGSFTEYQQDYDAEDIYYVGFDIGRYYVYKLNSLELFPILYNKYTGEIYSEKAGLPFVGISRGFINVSWLYQ